MSNQSKMSVGEVDRLELAKGVEYCIGLVQYKHALSIEMMEKTLDGYGKYRFTDPASLKYFFLYEHEMDSWILEFEKYIVVRGQEFPYRLLVSGVHTMPAKEQFFDKVKEFVAIRCNFLKSLFTEVSMKINFWRDCKSHPKFKLLALAEVFTKNTLHHLRNLEDEMTKPWIDLLESSAHGLTESNLCGLDELKKKSKNGSIVKFFEDELGKLERPTGNVMSMFGAVISELEAEIKRDKNYLYDEGEHWFDSYWARSTIRNNPNNVLVVMHKDYDETLYEDEPVDVNRNDHVLGEISSSESHGVAQPLPGINSIPVELKMLSITENSVVIDGDEEVSDKIDQPFEIQVPQLKPCEVAPLPLSKLESSPVMVSMLSKKPANEWKNAKKSRSIPIDENKLKLAVQLQSLTELTKHIEPKHDRLSNAEISSSSTNNASHNPVSTVPKKLSNKEKTAAKRAKREAKKIAKKEKDAKDDEAMAEMFILRRKNQLEQMIEKEMQVAEENDEKVQEEEVQLKYDFDTKVEDQEKIGRQDEAVETSNQTAAPWKDTQRELPRYMQCLAEYGFTQKPLPDNVARKLAQRFVVRRVEEIAEMVVKFEQDREKQDRTVDEKEECSNHIASLKTKQEKYSKLVDNRILTNHEVLQLCMLMKHLKNEDFLFLEFLFLQINCS